MNSTGMCKHALSGNAGRSAVSRSLHNQKQLTTITAYSWAGLLQQLHLPSHVQQIFHGMIVQAVVFRCGRRKALATMSLGSKAKALDTG